MSERPIIFSAPMVRAILAGRKTMTRRLATSPLRKCEPDDLLWVREAWKPHSIYAGMKPRDVPDTEVFYRADDKYAPSNTPWIPSIHMPRWASRIMLRVTGVKVERLRDITNEDAIAEGIEERLVETSEGEKNLWFGIPHVGNQDAIQAFADLWDSLHNPHGYCAEDAPHSWLANPEVVAISFERQP